MICWNESDGEVKCITEAEAVAYQRKAGRLRNYEYQSDADALDDFMVVHWAWKQEQP